MKKTTARLLSGLMDIFVDKVKEELNIEIPYTTNGISREEPQAQNVKSEEQSVKAPENEIVSETGSFGEIFYRSGDFKFMEYEGGLMVAEYIGSPGVRVIRVPEIINGKRVICLGPCSLQRQMNVQEIYLPDSITDIREEAISECESLKKVTFGAFTNNIDKSALSSNMCLETVILPNLVTELGEGVFFNTALTQIRIPGTIKKVPNNTFEECTCLTQVEIEEGVESIGEYVFQGCEELRTVTVPASARQIDENAFVGGGSDMTMITAQGTYAEEYAKRKRISFRNE